LLEFGLGDWCQSTIYDSGGFETPLEITDSLVGYDLCQKAAKIFAVLGMMAEKAEIDLLADELMDSFRKKWVDESGYAIKSKTQTAQSMALRNGVFAPDKKAAAAGELVSRIHRDNSHFNVGVVGAYGLFETLAENGYVELAYRLITQKTPPSYGYIAELGESTLWECMYDFGESESPIALKHGERINSMNHHFWGFVYSFFVKYVAGLRMNPGFDDISYAEIQPNSICGLTHAEADYETPNGKLSVGWERKAGRLYVRVSVPAGMKVKLSVQGKEEFLTAGNYKKVYKDL
jgi:alpha-L-rhamnosidase